VFHKLIHSIWRNLNSYHHKHWASQNRHSKDGISKITHLKLWQIDFFSIFSLLSVYYSSLVGCTCGTHVFKKLCCKKKQVKLCCQGGEKRIIYKVNRGNNSCKKKLHNYKCNHRWDIWSRRQIPKDSIDWRKLSVFLVHLHRRTIGSTSVTEILQLLVYIVLFQMLMINTDNITQIHAFS